ncbi:MAG: response regulator [Phycisphaerae bacterium]|jgi:two-component system cell cycle response regulator CpdR
MARIVIAEDQAYLRHVLMRWIARSGHEVVGVSDGREALACVQNEPTDMLVTDVMMPCLNGIELTRKALATCPSLRRVFVVTSLCDPQALLDQLPDPRVRIFPKPFSPSQLLREIDLATTVAPQPEGGRA